MRDVTRLGAELTKLGHDIRLMPPAYVKPDVKRGKTDANDAEAICKAVTRPTMRLVAVKAEQQLAALALHRTRGQLTEVGIEMARAGIMRSTSWPNCRAPKRRYDRIGCPVRGCEANIHRL